MPRQPGWRTLAGSDFDYAIMSLPKSLEGGLLLVCPRPFSHGWLSVRSISWDRRSVDGWPESIGIAGIEKKPLPIRQCDFLIYV